MKKITLAIIFMTLSLLANNVATITALKGKADLRRDSEVLIAMLGDKLEQKDNLITKENSKLQLIFEDETVVSIGKNSEFSIQEYLFDDKNEPVARFNMLRGAMRTITGQIGDIAPQKFSVSTSTATIGIRGTNFSVFVEDDGSSSAFCTFGAISVAVSGTTHIVQQGFYLSISPVGEVEVKEFTPEILKEKKEEHFDDKKEQKDVVATSGNSKGTTTNDDSTNDSQLDVTITDDSGMIITDVTETVGDVTQNETQSLSELIAGYTMANASYSGSWTYISGSSGDFGMNIGDTGTATLGIDFGADTADLTLSANKLSVQLNNTTSFTNTGFSLTNEDGDVATGTFQGDTGNSVSGTYDVGAGGSSNMVGTYDVSTSQTLY